MKNIFVYALFLLLELQMGFCGGFNYDPVQVTVFYETLCPYCKDFLSNQVWPTFQQVSDIFTVTLVPFGNAQFTKNGSSWDFSCQHGPNECIGNKIHSCVLELYPSNSDSLPFIGCTEGAADPIKSSHSCAKKCNLDWSLIESCFNSNLANYLLHQNGVKTKSAKPSIQGVPWILIDGVYSDEMEEEAQNDLLQLLCDKYLGPKPDECYYSLSNS